MLVTQKIEPKKAMRNQRKKNLIDKKLCFPEANKPLIKQSR